MTNLQTASNAAPSVLVAQYVPATGAAQYTAAVGTTADLVSVSLHNTDTASRTVTFSVVRSGGAAGGGNRKLETVTMAGKATIELGQMMLGDGDFIWAEAGTVSTISLIVTGIEFSNATGAVVSGIHVDAIGSGGHGAAGTVSGTNLIGTAPNRRLVAALFVQELSASTGWAGYTGGGPTLAASGTPMTRKISIDFNNGGGIAGSVHLFVLDNPTSGSTLTLAGAAAATGATMGLLLASKSYYGVDLAAGLSTVSTGPVGAAVMSLPYTTAAGHVPVFAGAFFEPPQAHNMSAIRFDGLTSAFTVPKWLLMADQFGLSSLTATVSNSTQHCGVGFDMTPA